MGERPSHMLMRVACGIHCGNVAGGNGVAISEIRASGSYIRGTNGYSNGLVPMLRVFNDTARYVDQGGGKRKGSFAMYLEPWHADISKGCKQAEAILLACAVSGKM